MSDAYREEQPPTRAEFSALEARLRGLERRKPKAPFVLRLWHTFSIGVAGVAGAIYSFGWMYDNMPANGTRVSLYFTFGLFGLIALVMGIASLAMLEDRKGLRDPWRQD